MPRYPKKSTFPNETYPVKELIIFIDTHPRHNAGVYPSLKLIQKGQLFIALDISNMDKSPDRVIHTIKHECYHIQTTLKHNNDQVRHKILALDKKLSKPIRKNSKLLRKASKRLFWNSNIDNTKHVRRWFNNAVQSFGNQVDDATLGVIALELNDFDFLKFAFKHDHNLILALLLELKYPKEQNQHVGDALLNLYDFATCIACMPYQGIALPALAKFKKMA